MSQLNEDQRPDFSVTINFKKGTRNPARVFKTAASFIEALQSLDTAFVQSIDTTLRPVLLLEEIESGSIKIWLKSFLEAVDDEALKKIDWKPAIGKYLVKAKYLILERLGEAKKLESREMLEQIATDINKLARETDVLRMPAYRPITTRDIAEGAKLVSDSLRQLEPGETVSLASDEGDAVIDAEFLVTQEQIDELLAGEEIENLATKILMVRRPDFLGDAMWEFRHEKRGYSARIEDTDWLDAFRTGSVDIRPDDALKVRVLEIVSYDRRGEVLNERRTIEKVLGVIREVRQKLHE